jgi:Methyltransferase domain
MENIKDNFTKAWGLCEPIPGAFEPQSLSIFLTISSLCNLNNRAIEFGVLHGKSATALVHGFKDTVLVDKTVPTYLETLKSHDVNKSITFHELWSTEFFKIMATDDFFSFCHIDTSHYFNDTLNELTSMSCHMMDQGVIVLDDWNDLYQQVRAGFFYARYKNDIDWHCFLVAHNKAYLCKSKYLEYYLSKVAIIKRDLDFLGFKSQIIRTDDNPLYCPFFLRPLKAGEEEYYGTVTYGDRFFKILEK